MNIYDWIIFSGNPPWSMPVLLKTQLGNSFKCFVLFPAPRRWWWGRPAGHVKNGWGHRSQHPWEECCSKDTGRHNSSRHNKHPLCLIRSIQRTRQNCLKAEKRKISRWVMGRHPFLRWWGVGLFLVLESWGLANFSYWLRLPFRAIFMMAFQAISPLLLAPAPRGDQNMQGIRCYIEFIYHCQKTWKFRVNFRV